MTFRWQGWVVGISVAAVLVGCSGDKKDDGGQTTPPPSQGSSTSGPATTPGSGGGSTSGELGTWVTRYRDLKSFKASISVEAAGAPVQQGTLEFVKPDRFHVLLGGLEVIGIGTDTYVKFGTSWTKAPATGGAFISPALITGLASALQTEAGWVKGGTATVDGKTCQIYTNNTSGSTEVCIANDTVLRLVNQNAGQKFTVIYSEFDRVPEIRAPI